MFGIERAREAHEQRVKEEERRDQELAELEMRRQAAQAKREADIRKLESGEGGTEVCVQAASAPLPGVLTTTIAMPLVSAQTLTRSDESVCDAAGDVRGADAVLRQGPGQNAQEQRAIS